MMIITMTWVGLECFAGGEDPPPERDEPPSEPMKKDIRHTMALTALAGSAEKRWHPCVVRVGLLPTAQVSSFPRSGPPLPLSLGACLSGRRLELEPYRAQAETVVPRAVVHGS